MHRSLAKALPPLLVATGTAPERAEVTAARGRCVRLAARREEVAADAPLAVLGKDAAGAISTSATDQRKGEVDGGFLTASG